MRVTNAQSLYTYTDYDVCIIDFCSIFEQSQTNLLQHAHFTLYNIYNTFDRNCKRYFLHFLIKECFNTIITLCNKNKIIVIHKGYLNNHYKIWSVFDRDIIHEFIILHFGKLKYALPFPIYIVDDEIDFNNIESGETIEVLNICETIINNCRQQPKNIRLLEQFVDKNGLTNIKNELIGSGQFCKLLYDTA